MNNKAVTIIATFLLQAFLSIQVNGQDLASLTYDKLLPDFQQMTPEVASLGQYGNVGVSAYTGSPDIKIPLFNVTSGATSLPVFLYYDASGIKVTQEATFVGLGWNLSFGGCINHIVCGYDDFSDPENKSYAYFKQNIKPYILYNQYRFHRGYIASGELNFKVYFIHPQEEDEFYLIKDLANGLHIPDIFQASFCGHSVSFIIDWETKMPIIIKSDGTKYKIECNIQYKTQYPEFINITDDHGVTYQFSAYKEFDKKDSFYLTKIYGSDGPEGKSVIDITYQQIYCEGGAKRYQSIAEIASQNDIPNEASLAFITAIQGKRTQLLSTYGTFNYGCTKVYPSTIVTRQQTVKFELKDREDVKKARSISHVSVEAPDGTLIHDIKFNYSYFEESKSNEINTGKRLKLNDISVDGKRYEFQYDESASLPNSNSCALDFWGYYNGCDKQVDLCSSPKYKQLEDNQYSCIEYLGEANRFASANKSKTWTINRITYPTGGYTDFEMEANRFLDDYYYPSAETEASKHYQNTLLTSLSINAYYDSSTSKTVTINLDKAQEVQIQVGLSTNNTKTDTAYVSIQNTTSKTYITNINTSDQYPHGDPSKTVQKILFEPGEYVIKAAAVSANRSPLTNANVNVSYSKLIMESSNDGASIGGGLRVKSVKDYDSGGKFVGGKEYEYQGGKLLRPTPQIEHHYVDYKYESKNRESDPVKYKYDFVSSEPSYYYVCSLGAPANVGYSTVIEKEISKSGQIVSSTTRNFWNTGYDLSVGINTRINRFYKNDTDLKNGKLKSRTVLSPENKIMHCSSYNYTANKGESVMYAMCEPTFLEHNELREFTYDLTVLNVANIWNNIESQTETDYVSGKSNVPVTTEYTYNTSNNQPSVTKTSNGTTTIETRKYYPSDSKTTGDNILQEKHCISEVTKIENYIDGSLIGGGRYAYVNVNGAPKVNKVFSLQRNRSEILELTVDLFDEKGNIRQYTSRDGNPTTLLWSYNYQYPVMMIVGGKYNDIKNCSSSISSIGSAMKFGNGGLSNITSLRNSIVSTLSNKSNHAHITAYNYNPWFNVSDIIEPNGLTSHYGYDGFGRLNLISDILGTKQKFEYNFKNAGK